MYEDVKEFIRSKTFKGILFGFGLSVIFLLIFQAGIAVGYRKAAFAFKFGENYYRVFDKNAPRMGSLMLRGGFPDAHGATGKIVSISLPTFVVAGQDSMERVVIISDDVSIRRQDGEILPSDLKVDDFVVVFGEADEDSQIKAKLIRVMPTSPQGKIRIKVNQ
jgi:hypothetical protein